MKRVLAILLATLASAGASRADELDVARAALRDGLWETARAHAGRVTGSETNTAKIVILESYAGAGDWQGVASALEACEGLTGDTVDYYRAVVKGDVERSVELLKRSGSAVARVDALMRLADLESSRGNRAAAERAWRVAAVSTNAGERALVVAAANLEDERLLRRAVAETKSLALRRLAGLRLGRVLVRSEKTRAEGTEMIRAIVKDAPDADGAREAFLTLADLELAASRWKEAGDLYRDAVEIWPDVAKWFRVQEGRGWCLFRLGRREEALATLKLAETSAEEPEDHARVLLELADVRFDLGRIEEAMATYGQVQSRFPETSVARKMEGQLKIRRREAEGREAYRAFRFDDARKAFAEVAAADPSRKARMDYFGVLCLYGLGHDGEAARLAETLSATSADPTVRAQAALWLAKLSCNRGEWKRAARLFVGYADAHGSEAAAPVALAWAARAALADGDYGLAIQSATRLAAGYPDSPELSGALLVQGEALVELARFDEAVLVLESVVLSARAPAADRQRANLLKADALFAMGADNPARYQAALEAYRAIRNGAGLDASALISVSFKIGRALERLKRIDEALDQYYADVVLAYREGRARGEWYSDEARAAFSRAATRLADEYESRGKRHQAIQVLGLLATSDVPAAAEARRRIERIDNEGRF